MSFKETLELENPTSLAALARDSFKVEARAPQSQTSNKSESTRKKGKKRLTSTKKSTKYIATANKSYKRSRTSDKVDLKTEKPLLYNTIT